MADVMVMQGRKVGEADIGLIRDWLAAYPEWNRTRLSQELCACWNWRNAQGRAKDMAARTLLLKLERAGYIRLPEQLPSFHDSDLEIRQITSLTDTICQLIVPNICDEVRSEFVRARVSARIPTRGAVRVRLALSVTQTTRNA